MRVLVCALNWGLGHATRCVPVIRMLLREGYDVVVASDGYPLCFLQQEFPDLAYEELPPYGIRYAKGQSQVWAMLRNLPRIVLGVVREHYWLKAYLRRAHVDLLVSDNRFGLWQRGLPSVYITHQLNIKLPKGLKALEPLCSKLHASFISRHASCWIPDVATEENLSGALSHGRRLPSGAEFVGFLSRFQGLEGLAPDSTCHTLCILSGVEPQRSLMEAELIERFRHTGRPALIVQGKPKGERREERLGDVCLVSHLPDDELAACILGAEHIISCSGYSTLMDLAVLGCLSKAELRPTPGQPEQEYLFEYLSCRNGYKG